MSLRLEQNTLLTKIANRLTSNQRIFFAEIIGTFIVVILATGSVVRRQVAWNIRYTFHCLCSIYWSCSRSLLIWKNIYGDFNPAVTVGFLITKHITRVQLFYYFSAEIIGALLASLSVKFVIGNQANLGANAPNYAFPIPTIIGVEIAASAMLMSVIYVVVYSRGLRGFSGIVIGGIVGLDIFFLAFISGASMNPARSLAPALVSGVLNNLWLYWSATFMGTSIVAVIFRKVIVSNKS